jgi:hypothetical protein
MALPLLVQILRTMLELILESDSDEAVSYDSKGELAEDIVA